MELLFKIADTNVRGADHKIIFLWSGTKADQNPAVCWSRGLFVIPASGTKVGEMSWPEETYEKLRPLWDLEGLTLNVLQVKTKGPW